MGQGRVGLARGHVIVAVLVQRKVGRTHGEAREAQADSGTGPEQLLQQGVALSRGQTVLYQPRRRVGDGGAEAHHFLIRGRFGVHDRGQGRRRSASVEVVLGFAGQELRRGARGQPHLGGGPAPLRRRPGGRLPGRHAPARHDDAERPGGCPQHQNQPGFCVRFWLMFSSDCGSGRRLLGTPCWSVSPGEMVASSAVFARIAASRMPQRDRSNQRCPSNTNSRRRSRRTESRNAAVESPDTAPIPARVRTALSACSAVIAATGAPPSFTASAYISSTSAYRSTIQLFDCLTQARWCMFWKSVWSKYLMNAGPYVLSGSFHFAVSPSASTYPDLMNVPPRPRVSDAAKRFARDGATVMSP